MRKSRRNKAVRPQDDLVLNPGDRVIIRMNPHHPGAEDIVGTVVVFRPGEGFGGCDLVEVHYKHPRDGKGHTMPFGLSCLGSADKGSFLALAERYEALAAQIRVLAVDASSATHS